MLVDGAEVPFEPRGASSSVLIPETRNCCSIGFILFQRYVRKWMLQSRDAKAWMYVSTCTDQDIFRLNFFGMIGKYSYFQGKSVFDVDNPPTSQSCRRVSFRGDLLYTRKIKNDMIRSILPDSSPLFSRLLSIWSFLKPISGAQAAGGPATTKYHAVRLSQPVLISCAGWVEVIEQYNGTLYMRIETPL